jgi:hypothetical protein
VERAKRVEQGRDAVLHPAPRVDVDLEAEDATRMGGRYTFP